MWLRVHILDGDQGEFEGSCGIADGVLNGLGLQGARVIALHIINSSIHPLSPSNTQFILTPFHSLQIKHAFGFKLTTHINCYKEGPFVVSLFKSSRHAKDLLPLECVDEPVQREVLVYAHGVETDEKHNELLCVSSSFVYTHGLYAGEYVHVRAVDESVLGLDKVVLMASSAEAYHEATVGTNENQANQRFKDYLLSLPVVVAQGTTISMQQSSTASSSASSSSSSSSHSSASSSSSSFQELLNFQVLDCQPFLQGLLVSSTQISVLAPKEHIMEHSTISQYADAQQNTQDQKFYVSSFILPTYSSDTPLFRIGKSSSSLPPSISSPPSTLPPSSMQVSLLARPIEVTYPAMGDRDIQYEVGVTLRTLRHFHIFSGALVELASQISAHKVVAHIFAVDNHPNQSQAPTSNFLDYTLYLSPLLAYNLGFEATYWLSKKPQTTQQANIVKVISPLRKLESGTAPIPSPPASASPPPSSSSTKSITTQTPSFPPTPFLPESYPTASRVTLSRIKGPISYTRTAELRRFFKNPKLVKVGDIISITISHSMVNVENEDEEALDDVSQEVPTFPTIGSWESDYATSFSSMVFFRVASLAVGSETFTESSPLVWVLRGDTMLEQRGVISCTLPALARSYLNPHPFLSTTQPLVLETDLSSVPCVGALLHVLRPALYPMSLELGLSFSVLVSGKNESGKDTAIRQVTDMLGANLIELDCYDIIPYSPTSSQVEAALQTALSGAYAHVPCVLVLRNITFLDVVAQQQQQQQQGGSSEKKGVDLVDIMEQLRQEARGKHHIMLVGTVEKSDRLSPALRAWFRHEVAVAPPDEGAREVILSNSLAKFGFHHPEQIQHLAKQTVSLFPRDLHSLVAHATLAAKKRVLKRVQEGEELAEGVRSARNRSVVAAGVSISQDDLAVALGVLQAHHASAIGAPKVPDIRWEDVGGLGEAKKEILDTIQIPLLYPWFSSGVTPRSGILLFGPPGTGKTLLAKAVATECKLNFLSVKGPELINMYVGESERNIREIFQKAREARPCVIFFDELDSLAPKRGQGADSGGVMDRIVSQFLTELNGLSKSHGLFVIGATNRPDLIDDALLIPGRFERKVYLGISPSREEQVKVMKALTRKFNLGDDVKLDLIAEECTTTLTGADFYALCSDAFQLSMKEYISVMTSNPSALASSDSNKEVKIVVEQRHFLTAVRRLKPSVSAAELAYYKKLQDQFRSKKA